MFPRVINHTRTGIVMSTGFAFAMAFATAICAAAQPGTPTTTASGTAAATVPVTAAPAAAPASAPASAPAATAPATAPTVTVPVPVPPSGSATTGKVKKPAKKSKISVTQFVGQINATHVNIRSGPGLSYYAIGQLARGDLIKVTGERNGWYRFAAPAGARCYIARQFVKLGADGSTGTVTGSFVNVRAASALTPASNYAVVDLLNTGATVSVTGQTPKYDIIRAPKGTGFYILARFVSPAPAGSTYVTPQLTMPAGFKGAGLPTGSTPAAIASTATPGTGAGVPATTASVNTAGGGLSAPVPPIAANSGTSSRVVPAPVSPTMPAAVNNTPAATSPATPANAVTMPGGLPAPVKFSADAFSTYSHLTRQMQAQFNKPIMQRQLQPLLTGFENLMKKPHLPNSVIDGSNARIKLLKKQIAIQEIVAASQKQKPLTAVLAPYQQQWEQSQKELAQAEAKAPYIAYGILKTSTVLKKYALVDPTTGRVVAYLDPSSKIDISKLLGSYIGVKGEVVSNTGVVVHVIKVTAATMFSQPPAGQ